jgi:hypothetical protein
MQPVQQMGTNMHIPSNAICFIEMPDFGMGIQQAKLTFEAGI